MGRSRFIPLVFLGCLAIAPYIRTVGFSFVFDDLHLIVNNAFLRETWSPLTSFAHHFWYGTPFGATYYRPVVVTSFALNGRLLGWSPAGFHLVNVLLHAVNACLLMFLARRLGCSYRVALTVAALFAAHPVASWPVASIVARVDLLPTLFVLCAWLAWSTAVAAGDPPKLAILAGGFFLLALLSKETAAAFLVVPLMAIRRRGFPVRALATLAAVFALYLVLRSAIGLSPLPPAGTIDPLINPLAGLPLGSRLPAALALAGRYILYLVAPVPLTDRTNYFDAGTWPAAGDPVVLVGLGVIVLWSAVVALLIRRRDPIAAPVTFALVSFLPASNLIVPITSLYAQNFLYLPLVGLCLGLGQLLERHLTMVSRQLRRPALFAAPLVVALSFVSLAEAGIWRNGVTLFETWTRRFPSYPPAHSALGVCLLEAGEPGRAAESCRRALAITDRSFEAHYNLGVALLRLGADRSALEEALQHLRRAADLAPAQPLPRTNAGRALLLLDRPVEAVEEERTALRLQPDFTPALTLLVEALLRSGNLVEAGREVERERARHPSAPWLAELDRMVRAKGPPER